MSYFLATGDQIKIIADHKASVTSTLPLATYTINYNPMAGEFSLEISDDMKLPEKLYGNTVEKGEKIFNTFQRRDVATGVLLSGLKGTGKTLLAKYLSIAAREMGMSTILVNESYENSQGFMKFIQSIDVPCVIIFDEFEKIYSRSDQNEILTLLDGVMSSKKLYVLTCNDSYKITDHVYNRPSRVYYSIDYGTLNKDFLKDYCADNLVNKEYTQSVINAFTVFSEVNFDMLQTVVEEVNVTDAPAADIIADLNVSPSNQSAYGTYEIISVTFDGVEIPLYTNKWSGNFFDDISGITTRGINLNFKIYEH